MLISIISYFTLWRTSCAMSELESELKSMICPEFTGDEMMHLSASQNHRRKNLKGHKWGVFKGHVNCVITMLTFGIKIAGSMTLFWLSRVWYEVRRYDGVQLHVYI